MKPILLTAAGNPENQDRGLVVDHDSGIVLCVADGAGGPSGGTEAACMAVEMVRQNAGLLNNAASCAEVLRRMDAAIAKDSISGETTCVLVVVTAEKLFGASVGDSGAWLIPASGNHVELTQAQQRKPFIGSGSAWPVSFHLHRQVGRLLLATDGLLKYASAERIIEVCRVYNTDATAQRLIELVRYDLQYPPQTPPEILYHGTATRFLDGSRGVNLRPDDVKNAVEEMIRAGVGVVQSAELLSTK